MWATVGPDHIYFSNNKKCIIYNTLYLIIHRVCVAAILIGFILKCHISLNFWLKLIGKLFFGHLSLPICPLTSNLKTDSTKTAHNRPENCQIIWIFLDWNFSRSLKRNIFFLHCRHVAFFLKVIGGGWQTQLVILDKQKKKKITNLEALKILIRGGVGEREKLNISSVSPLIPLFFLLNFYMLPKRGM